MGGSVRDALLGRRADYLDLDFVVPEGAIAAARLMARRHRAGFVVLDAEHQIARVVFPQATVDFAAQVGESLTTDLHRRDFTVNAIAFDPQTGQIFDPLGGYQDLQRGILRMIAPDNLADDPLRLLRAYRQAAQLNFTLEANTRTTIHQLAPLIGAMAAERVRGELDCLLSHPEGTPLLRFAWEDGVLAPWLPDLGESALETLAGIDQALARLPQDYPALLAPVQGWLKDRIPPGIHRSWYKAAKLSQLLPPEGAEAAATLAQLKYSRAEQQAVLALGRGWQWLRQAGYGPLSPRQQYDLFKAMEGSFPGVALVALAQGYDPAQVRAWGDRFFDPQDAIAHPSSLIGGRTLIHDLHLPRGPAIGQWLIALELAHAEGQISTPEEAMAWVKAQIAQRGLDNPPGNPSPTQGEGTA